MSRLVLAPLEPLIRELEEALKRIDTHRIRAAPMPTGHTTPLPLSTWDRDTLRAAPRAGVNAAL